MPVEDDAKTLNADGINRMVGASSAPITSDGLNDPTLDTQRTNTVDDPAVPSTAKDANDDKAGDAKGNEDKEAQDKDKALKGDDDRFDKHPRWIEREERLKKLEDDFSQEREARIRAEERAKIVEEQSGVRKTGEEKAGDDEKLPFEDVSQLTDEQIQEKLTDNPRQFIGNLYLQIEHEIMQKIGQKEEQEKSLTKQEKDFNDFRTAYPDYDELFSKKGGVLDYMKDHPGTTRKEAYFALTDESRIERAKQEAVEKAKKEFDANVRAKQGAGNVLGTGSPASGGSGDVFQEKLSDTKKHGGIVSVLAEKVAAMRRSSHG